MKTLGQLKAWHAMSGEAKLRAFLDLGEEMKLQSELLERELNAVLIATGTTLRIRVSLGVLVDPNDDPRLSWSPCHLRGEVRGK